AEDTRRLIEPVASKVEKAAREAIRLDPRQAPAYAAVAMVQLNQKHWAAAEDLFRKALELDPYDPELLVEDGFFLLKTGGINDSLRVMQQAHALEPLVPRYAYNVAEVRLANNQPAAAIAMIDSVAGCGLVF